MKRFFRITGKKKGSRLSGSRRLGGVGEVTIASTLAIFGLVCTVMVVSLQWTTLQSGGPPRWGYFTMQMLAAIALNSIGVYGISRVLWNASASMERRGAIVTRAREINLLNEVKPVDDIWPAVPVELGWTLIPGMKLSFQLKQKQKPRWNLIASGLLVVIFVAVASILTAMNWDSFLLGSIDVLGVILNLALIIASIWSFRIFVIQLLKITGIGPTRLEINEFPLRCGHTYELLVFQSGRIRLKLFDLLLICEEEATFQDGTDLRSESRQVFSSRIFRKRGLALEQNAPLELQTNLTIPINAMHSFQAANNKVNWSLHINCTARGWPDLTRTFPIVVAPIDSIQSEPAAPSDAHITQPVRPK